jgi:hypothetical protein
MAEHATVEFNPTPIKVGPEWRLVATHPSGQQEHISGFHTEAEAIDWLSSNGFAAWMRTRRYTAVVFPERRRQT